MKTFSQKWRRINRNWYTKGERPENGYLTKKRRWVFSPEDESADAESQREMTLEKVKLILQVQCPKKHLPERNGWNLYRSLSELVLSRRWDDAERAELICQGATPQKTGIFLRGGFSFLLEGKWADPESQKGMVQDKGGISMSRRSALKKEHLPKRKDLIFCRRVSNLMMSSKEGWRREWEK